MAHPAVKVKTPTLATGAERQSGFTLLELIVALTIVAMLAGLSMPMAGRMLDGMRYREGLREVRAALESARYRAITQGRPVDVRIYPADRRLEVPGRRALILHESLSLQATTAREVNQAGAAVIRYFPDGGATGGEVVVQRGNSGPGSRLRVDWLLGRTTLHALDA